MSANNQPFKNGMHPIVVSNPQFPDSVFWYIRKSTQPKKMPNRFMIIAELPCSHFALISHNQQYPPNPRKTNSTAIIISKDRFIEEYIPYKSHSEVWEEISDYFDGLFSIDDNIPMAHFIYKCEEIFRRQGLSFPDYLFSEDISSSSFFTSTFSGFARACAMRKVDPHFMIKHSDLVSDYFGKSKKQFSKFCPEKPFPKDTILFNPTTGETVKTVFSHCKPYILVLDSGYSLVTDQYNLMQKLYSTFSVVE